MLGVTAVVVALVGAILGMELRSPGVIVAMVHASEAVLRTSHNHTGAKICAQLVAHGETEPRPK